MLLARVLSIVVVVLTLFACYMTAQPSYSDWSAPVNLGPVVNSSTADATPAVSKTGLSLYFNSSRPGGFGGLDIWVSQRDSVEDPWGLPINLGAAINTTGLESGPALSRDEHWLFFFSIRDGGFGARDIWASYREHTHDDFDWQPPVNLGSGVNSAFEETGAAYFENDDTGVPQFFFASNRPGGVGAFDFYVSDLLPEGTFGPARLVPELSSGSADPGIVLRFDGLEAFFFSTRSGGFGVADLWSASRETVHDSWSQPTNLGPLINTAAIDQGPSIASDRQTLYFASDRAGGFGGMDLYVTTRTRQKP